MTFGQWVGLAESVIGNWKLEPAARIRSASGGTVPHAVRVARNLVEDARLLIREAEFTDYRARLYTRKATALLGLGANGLDAVEEVLGTFDRFLAKRASNPTVLRDWSRRSTKRPSMCVRLRDMDDGSIRMAITDDDDPDLDREWEFPKGTDRRQAMAVAQEYLAGIMGDPS
jgi:hypothetical protein